MHYIKTNIESTDLFVKILFNLIPLSLCHIENIVLYVILGSCNFRLTEETSIIIHHAKLLSSGNFIFINIHPIL